jgi:hypothetical protein
MKKIVLAAVIPAAFALAACGGAATEDESPAETAAPEDDNDAPEPVAEPVSEEEPHDESVPHDH